MSGRSVAYIGAPPPHLRKRKQRDPSPAPVVPDSPPAARRDAFDTPARSTRVFKTYAHKRARSYASSAAGDDVESEDQSSSSSSSPEISPTKVRSGPHPHKITASTSKRPLAEPPRQATEGSTALVTALNERRRATTDAHISASTAPEVSSPDSILRRKQSDVYVEIPSKPSAVSLPEGARIGPPRGRRPKAKSKPTIAMPSPPPTSDDSSAVNMPQPQYHPSLSDALNSSFANAPSVPTGNDNLLAESSSVPPKRKRGRPPGRTNSLAGLGPIINSGGPSSSPTRKAAFTQTASAPVVAPAPPVKRGPGRPRKHPLPVASTSAPIGRPSSSKGPSSSKKPRAASNSPEDDSETDAVVAQLLQGLAHSPDGAPTSSSTKTSKEKPAYQSVDISPIARALERQAADEAANPADTGHIPPPTEPPAKKRRGRPPGSKNKSTLEREAQAAAQARAGRTMPHSSPFTRTPLTRTAAAPTAPTAPASATPSLAPVPIKRPRGRPRKSAPAGTTLEYYEPLKDPDADAPVAGPSTPKRRGRSSTRRNSIAALPYSPLTPVAPPTPSPYYLDLNTMQWRRRTRSASTPAPVARRRRSSAFVAAAETGEVTEYQTSAALCAALKEALLAVVPKLGQGSVQGSAKGKGKGTGRSKSRERRKSGTSADGGLKVAQSGVLLVADDDDEDAEAGTLVFRGAWSVLGDPSVALDDGLVLKKLHEIVMGIGAVTMLDQAEFSRGVEGRTVTVSVPCCCLSLRPGAHTVPSSDDADEVEGCQGEMAVSVAEAQPTSDFVGLAKALRTTVVVVH